MKSLFTIDYDKQALKRTTTSLHDARRELIESVQQKLRIDCLVIFATNRVKYLEKVVSTLEENADGKKNSITNIVDVSSNK